MCVGAVEHRKGNDMQRYIKPKRILSKAETMARLGNIGRTAFELNFVQTGRLKKLHVTQKRIGFCESAVDALVDEIAAGGE